MLSRADPRRTRSMACWPPSSPPPCVVCGRVAERPIDGAACESCWKHHPIHHAAVLRLLRRAVAVDPHTGSGWRATPRRCLGVSRGAARCAENPPLVDAARALGPYEGTLRDLVHSVEVRRPAFNRPAAGGAAARAVRGRARRRRRRRAGAAAPQARVEPRLQPGRRDRPRARPAGVAASEAHAAHAVAVHAGGPGAASQRPRRIWHAPWPVEQLDDASCVRRPGRAGGRRAHDGRDAGCLRGRAEGGRGSWKCAQSTVARAVLGHAPAEHRPDRLLGSRRC